MLAFGAFLNKQFNNSCELDAQVKTAVEWTRAEFMEGMVRMGYDSIAKVKAGLPILQVTRLSRWV